MTTHPFPATQSPTFDAEYFNQLCSNRILIDYRCYLYLVRIFDELPERYQPAALKLITEREIACDKALNYVVTGEKQ